MFNRFKVHLSRMEKVISPVSMQIGDLWQHCSVTFLPIFECNCSCFHLFFYNIKWCSILLHHVDSLWLCINIIHAEWYGITLKVISKDTNYQFVSLWSTWGLGLIYQKWCMLWPMFVWNMYANSYMIFQITLWQLTLDDIKRSNKCHITFMSLCL